MDLDGALKITDMVVMKEDIVEDLWRAFQSDIPMVSYA
jgi:hypothetical protein